MPEKKNREFNRKKNVTEFWGRDDLLLSAENSAIKWQQ